MSSRNSEAHAESAPLLSSSLVYRPPSYVEHLDPARLFPEVRPLEIELGTGDGSFLARYARARPTHNFIGVERLLGRLRKLDRKAVRDGLTNLRLIRIEASYLLQYLVPRESAIALHVYFPDPWPKRRHQKNRLINEQFTQSAQKALDRGGVIYLRTDEQNYFAQMISVFETNQAFRRVSTPPALIEVVTDFEADFQARGLPIFRAAYQRVS